MISRILSSGRSRIFQKSNRITNIMVLGRKTGRDGGEREREERERDTHIMKTEKSAKSEQINSEE